MEKLQKPKLILITGSPCVGKTTVAKHLFEACENSAFFDGDWAWCVNPFSLSDPRLRNGDKTMSFALSNYLNSGFETVIFPSVVTIGAEIRSAILADITAEGYTTLAFTLKCSEETLARRHKRREGNAKVSYRWLHMPPHPGDYVIHTDDKKAPQVAAEIKDIMDAKP